MLEQVRPSRRAPRPPIQPNIVVDPPEGDDEVLQFSAEGDAAGGGGGGGGGAPAGGGGGADIDPDMMLKPQRNNKGAALVALVIVVIGVVIAIFALRNTAEVMTDLQRIEIQKNIFVLPEKEQIVEWRKWASKEDADKDLRAEAISQLALLGDPEGVAIAIKALESPSHNVRGSVAQALTHYGLPAAEPGKAPLLKALKEATEADRRQIVWALVELKEPAVFKDAMELYRGGQIVTVQRLEGGRAFSPDKLASLVPIGELAKLAGDESSAIRQLVATVLSENADPKWTDTLIKLVKDPEIVVAREAANGLGKIGDEKARGPLVEALKSADKDSRKKFIEALRDGIGGVGLVLALDTVVKEPEQRRWFQLRQLFDMLHKLGDPRCGDALVAWVERAKPHKHWETEAGIVLAEVGDIRGAKYIGARMLIEPEDVYEKAKFWQADAGGHMTKTDRPRVIGARMLADLAVMYPDKGKELLEMAEEPMIKWLTSRPQPHANGLRFLAASRSEKILPRMRDWAFPKDPLPVEGAQPPFPRAYETAQSALRYIGWMQDKKSHGKLIDQFGRKEDGKMDITQGGLQGAGLAMLGMALRAVAFGAAQGLSQWGKDQPNDKAQEVLLEFIEDPLWHEEARQAACYALAWIAKPETMAKVIEKVGTYAADKDPKKQLIGACYAGTLARSPEPGAVGLMVDLLGPNLEIGVRVALGQAIGVAGLGDDKASEDKLFKMLGDPEMRNAAALALIMGGNKDTASRTMAMYADEKMRDAIPDLKDTYYRAYGYWSSADLDRGNLYRWVENANAMGRVKIGGAPQQWAIQRLQAQFDNLQFDNGPHSETRVVLRHRLIKAAKTGDAKQKKGAIMTLRFMKEQGALMALKGEKGETGVLAKKAFHALMNPALMKPEDLSKFKDDKK